MQVSRIEIFGFKSFMDRLVLPLDVGVTGVVGPNGCGKSNIVDALRWVLGETRVKNLRGGQLEDVIFNGTETLRPLGLAEVTLTLRAQEEDFFADLTSQDLEAEVIASEVEDEIESEEGLEEMSADDAQVDEGPRLRVIEGRLDQDQPEADIEEELEPLDIAQKLTSASSSAGTTLVNRFSWLRAATEVQVTRRLYRSGESEFFINRVPCRLKDIKELFRAVGLGARTHTIVAQGEVSRIVTAKSEERRRILEEAAGVQGFREKISGAERRLQETGVNISRIDDIIKEVARQVNSLKRQAARARNRQQLKDTLKDCELRVYRDSILKSGNSFKEKEIELEKTKAAEEELTLKLSEKKTKEESARTELLNSDVAADEVRIKIDAIKEELSNRARQRAQRQERLAEIKAFGIAKETETKRLEERERQMIERQAESKASIDSILTEEKQLSLQLEEHDEGLAEKIRELEITYNQLREQHVQKEATLRKSREELISSKSRLQSQKEQLEAASPIKMLEALQRDIKDLPVYEELKESKLLIQGLDIPDQYIKAVQAVLAERAAFLVVDQPHLSGAEILKALEERSLKENSQVFGLGLLKKGVSATSHQHVSSCDFPPLSSLIRAEDSHVQIVNSIFNNICFVNSLEQAVEYFNLNPESEVRLVTAAGDILTSDSIYSFRHDAGLVSITKEVQTLEKKCSELGKEKEVAEKELADLNAERVQIEEKLTLARKTYNEQQRRVRELGSQLGALKGRREVEQKRVEQLVQDHLRLNEQLAEVQQAISNFKTEQVALQEELERMQAGDETDLHSEVRVLQEEYLELDKSRKEGRTILSDLAREVEQVRNQLESERRKASQVELAVEKLRLELEHSKERVLEEYGEESLEFINQIDGVEKLPEEEKQALVEEAHKIRARILREGDVDPSSIEALEEESQRLTDLESQRVDLVTAERTLKQTILRLRDTSEKRFVKTFEAVKDNFGHLIPRLFGGGKGTLELSDPGNPLESGLEIVVRPPGKKLKSIELLSGGEKALCATALIFAMFLERPSPLCILDEVDAPLDDANLMRFVSMVKEMSTKTQFIMITHNKQSMAASDTLVGVTMEQPGASKVLSVSLQEAYQQVA